MTETLVLASGSEIRRDLLRRAGVTFDVVKARVDEDMAKSALLAEGAEPRDLADALAELKAQRVSVKLPDSWVIGCDQVLEIEGTLLSKPETREQAEDHLQMLRGKKHTLFSAAVIYENGQPMWRHVGVARLFMRDLSDGFIADYVTQNWDDIRYCVGAYMIEAEGLRLFSRIEGDYFSILGLPVLELLSFLSLRGKVTT